MSNIKFYTEEQVRKAIELSLLNAKLFIHKGLGDDKYFPTVYEALKNLTPIELPSDENIEEKAEFLFPTVNRMGGTTYIAHKSFIEGAKWMKEMILNKSK